MRAGGSISRGSGGLGDGNRGGKSTGDRSLMGRQKGYSRGVEAQRNGGFPNIEQYLAIGKAHSGGNCYGREREPTVHGTDENLRRTITLDVT